MIQTEPQPKKKRNNNMEKLENIKLYNGDCLEVMGDIPDGSIDAIIAGQRINTHTMFS